eukprot:12924616-Prorocentrum_lima.AAC.1
MSEQTSIVSFRNCMCSFNPGDGSSRMWQTLLLWHGARMQLISRKHSGQWACAYGLKFSSSMTFSLCRGLA